MKKRKGHLCSLLASFLIILLCATFAMAQMGTGTITGTVTDQSGAVVPGVRVTIANVNTGVTQKTTTTGAGVYTVPNLPPSNYTVTAEKQGFQRTTVASFQLTVEHVATINITLKVGQTTQSVSVQALAPLLQTSSASMGTTIGTQQILNLPLNGRNYLDLMTLAPGTTFTKSSNYAFAEIRGVGRRVNNQYSVGGGRAEQINFQLNGMRDVEPDYNTFAAVPSVDDVQEFKVMSNAYSAKYGQGASVVDATTKSGTNQIHGSAYDFMRNSSLDAKNYFDGIFAPDEPKPGFQRNQFGATAGGKIISDKLFYFGSYEGLRDRSRFIGTATVPTALARTGDLSEYVDNQGLPIYMPHTVDANGDPLFYSGNTLPAGCYVTDPNTNVEWANNIIPQYCIDPAVTKFLASPYVPPDNATAANGLYGNLVSTARSDTNYDQGSGRLDYVINSTNMLWGRYSYGREMDQSTDPLPTRGMRDDTITHTVNLNWTWTINPHMVNAAQAHYLRFNATNYGAEAFNTNVASAIGIPGTSNIPADWGAPDFESDDGLISLGEDQIGHPIENVDNVYEYTDNISISKGRHFMQAGAGFRREQLKVYSHNWPRGAFQITPGPTAPVVVNPDGTVSYDTNSGGLSPASFLMGISDISTLGVGDTTVHLRRWAQSYYIQDDWKIKPNLTINIGLRYEYAPYWHDTRNMMVNLDLSGKVPAVIRAGSGDPYAGFGSGVLLDNDPNSPTYLPFVRTNKYTNALVLPDHTNWGPRLGIAWTPGWGHGRTVIRAGGGIFYSPVIADEWFNFAQNAPRSLQLNLTQNEAVFDQVFAGLTPPFTIQQPFMLGVDVHSRTPRVQQWSFGIQHQFAPNLMLDVSYVGSGSTHLPHLIDINHNLPVMNNGQVVQPVQYLPQQYPNLPVFSNYFENATSANYNSLQVKFEKKYSNGFTFMSSYTWSKALDYNSSARDGGPDAWLGNATPHLFDLRRDYGPSVFDVRQNWVNSGLYELPFGQGKHWGSKWSKPVDLALGGWQIGGINVIHSGFSASCIVTDNAAVNNVGYEDDYCDSLAGINPNSGPHNIYNWWNVQAFRFPLDSEVFGNSGRGTLRGPGFVTFDFDALKTFPVSDKVNLQFRFEAYNILNHPVLGMPEAEFDSYPGADGSGSIPTTQTPAQLGVGSLGGVFGTIGSTAVSNRQLQFALKLLW
jgi:Carboxypeptidase regulatory-like domain